MNQTCQLEKAIDIHHLHGQKCLDSPPGNRQHHSILVIYKKKGNHLFDVKHNGRYSEARLLKKKRHNKSYTQIKREKNNPNIVDTISVGYDGNDSYSGTNLL